MRWRNFTPLTLVTIPAAIAVMSVSGWMLPEPFGSYNPMNPAIMRAEEVWQHAVKAHQPACMIFVGDSRIAFSINSAKIGTSCPARNYAFPGLSTSLSLDIADRTTQMAGRASVGVIGLSDAMVFVLSGSKAGKLTSPPAGWLELPLLRFLYLNTQRYAALYRQSALDDGWDWSNDLGRWTSNSIDNAVPIDSHPYKTNVIDGIAKSYFVNKQSPPDIDNVLQQVRDRISRVADNVVFILPPQHPDFRALADQLAPGQQQAMQDAVARFGAQHGILTIDCLGIESCGISRKHFVDPVHMSAEGATMFTSIVAERLRSHLGSTSFEHR